MFGQGGGSLYTPILFLLGYASAHFHFHITGPEPDHRTGRIYVYYRSNLIDIRFCALVNYRAYVSVHFSEEIRRVHQSRFS